MSIHEPLAQPLFTHADAVIAMGGDPNSLRAWTRLDKARNSKVKLRTTTAEGAWRRYSFEDIALLVVTRVLTDFGVPVEIANRAADENLPRASSLTPRQFVDLLKGVVLRGERHSDRRPERWRFWIAVPGEALPPATIRVELSKIVAAAYELADASFEAGEDAALAKFQGKASAD